MLRFLLPHKQDIVGHNIIRYICSSINIEHICHKAILLPKVNIGKNINLKVYSSG